MKFWHVVLLSGFIVGCHSARKTESSWAEFVDRQTQISWSYLQANISPREPKSPGQPEPVRGIVVAALSKRDPDYYFHWVRDSAHVMDTLWLYEPSQERLNDFVQLSRRLQKLPSPYGLGEPRYTVNAQLDPLKWSRPQNDGPALRALALMRFPGKPTEIHDVVKADIDFILKNYNQKCFDIWEELKADNYHTRLVQLAALQMARDRIKLDARMVDSVIAKILKDLDQHWSDEKGYYRSQLNVIGTDGYTKKATDLDSAVILAVLEAGRTVGRHSVTDDRVLSTVEHLENLFREAYPINQTGAKGLLYGRYQGDVYFGGNPWYLISAYYAQFYFRLARAWRTQGEVRVTSTNQKFLQTLLGRQDLPLGIYPSEGFWPLAQARGEAILQRLRDVTPADGQLYEQIDRVKGVPVSSRGIGWAHAAWLSAVHERSLVDE